MSASVAICLLGLDCLLCYVVLMLSRHMIITCSFIDLRERCWYEPSFFVG